MKISGIEIKCPHCDKLVRLELSKPLSSRKAKKLISKVEKLWRLTDKGLV